MRNKLLILIKRRKKIFFIITLILLLLGGGIRILEYYNKEFLFKQMIINKYFKAYLSANVFYLDLSDEYENFYDYLLTICKELLIICKYFFINFPCFIKDYYMAIYDYVHIEEIKSPFFKKYVIYEVMVNFWPDVGWTYAVAMDRNRFKVHEIGSGFGDIISINQKVLKNFNKLIIREKININSYEECIEFIKIFVKLMSDGNLILEDITSFRYYESLEEKPRKIEYRVEGVRIFSEPEVIFDPEYEGSYYVELHIREYIPIVMLTFLKKWTFKVKKTGVVYDFNEVVFNESLRKEKAIEKAIKKTN